MYCIGGHTLVSVLFAAVLITLFFFKTFSLLVYIYLRTYVAEDEQSSKDSLKKTEKSEIVG